jgi:hypothetical protein
MSIGQLTTCRIDPDSKVGGQVIADESISSAVLSTE